MTLKPTLKPQPIRKKYKKKPRLGKYGTIFAISLLIISITLVTLISIPVQVSFKYALPLDITELWLYDSTDILVWKWNITKLDFDYVEYISVNAYNKTPMFTNITYMSGDYVKLTAKRYIAQFEKIVAMRYLLFVPTYNYRVSELQILTGTYCDFGAPRTYHIINDITKWEEIVI